MLISYKWLQTYFDKPLPPLEKLAELFTFHSSEVEGIEKRGDDTIFDIKVLPDRAYYMLSERGAAREIASILGLAKKDKEVSEVSITLATKISVENQEPDFCLRYVSRLVENIDVTSSSAEIVKSLESVGSRGINNVVDSTNWTMLDIGQPLHAFDADKVKGSIVIRLAKEGEKIAILDGREIVLDPTVLVIADQEGALAIAGIKGGKRAEVTERTRRIILESANFDPISIRRTANKIAIHNDSSKRFENKVPPHLALQGMQEVSMLISEILPGAKFGPLTDIRGELPKEKVLTIEKDFISSRLGMVVSEKEIISILGRIGVPVVAEGGKYKLTISPLHLDLNSPEDIVEEIGRIYGYDKIAPVLPPKSKLTAINKTTYWSEKIKDVLVEQGFSEVFTYSLTNKGHVEIQNPLASDKNFLRTSLAEGVEKSLALNAKNADLLNLNQIRIFEIGTVFEKTGEHSSLAIGILNIKGRKAKKETEINTEIMNLIKNVLGLDASGIDVLSKGALIKNVFEINLDELIKDLPEPKNWDIKPPEQKNIKYKPISVYPFIVRDVAVFVPKDIPVLDVAKIIDKEAGPLKIRLDLFDVFTKKFENGEEKTSYAFRLVFQSPERTLREEEVGDIMKKVSEALGEHSTWQVR